MSRTKIAGHPLTRPDFDGEDADHDERLTSAANTLITRRSAVNFGVLCMIDAAQRDHAARMHAGIHSLEVDVSARSARLAGEGDDATA